MTPDSYYWFFSSLIAGFGALLGLLGVVAVYAIDSYQRSLMDQIEQIHHLLLTYKPALSLKDPTLAEKITPTMPKYIVREMGFKIFADPLLVDDFYDILKSAIMEILAIQNYRNDRGIQITHIMRRSIITISLSIIFLPFGDILYKWYYGWIILGIVIIFSLWTILTFGILVTDIFQGYHVVYESKKVEKG